MNGIKIVWRTAAAVVALLSLSLLTAGCIEELRQGGKVSFTASTGYLNGGVKGETKTFYSGDIQSAEGSRYERINWVTGDLVKIYCEQSLGQESDPTKKSAVYTVTAASSPSGATDKAEEIKPKSSDTDLRWDVSGGKHHFFAAYPSDVTFNTSYYAGKSDVIVFEHSVPAVQVVTQEVTRGTTAEFAPDMTLVAMGAYSGKEAGGLNPTVDLYFRPLVTTLRVELLSGDELSKSNNLTMLRLKSSYAPSLRPLAGSYKVAVGDYANNKTSVFTGSTDDNYKNTGLATVSVTSSEPSTATETSVRIVPQAGTPFEGGVRLNETTPTAFTFVMLPVSATDLTLELTFGGTYDATTQTVSGGTTRSLALKNNNISWSLAERRKNYLDMVNVKKKEFSVTYNSTPTFAPGGGVAADGGTVPLSSLKAQSTSFQVKTNLGGFTTTITSGDASHNGNAAFSVATSDESDVTTRLSTAFRSSEQSMASATTAGTTVGLPASGTFNPQPFTVSASGAKVYFSPGNLRYDAANSVWGFPAQQYDFIGEGPSNSSGTGWTDLFGWATSGWNGGSTYARTAYLPTAQNRPPADYRPGSITDGNDLSLVGANAHGDWGVHNSPIAGESWRLLTGAEMSYLLFTRTNSYIRAYIPPTEPSFTVTFTAKDDTKYSVSYTIEKPKVRGIILFPDGFNTGLIASSIRGQIGNRTADFQKIDNWAELENAGCVFLPLSPSRIGDVNVQTQTYNNAQYYTSTAIATPAERVSSTRLEFGTTYTEVAQHAIGIVYGVESVTGGYCVRLVKDTDWTGTTTPYNPDGTGGFGDGYSRLRLTAEAMWVGDATQVVAVMATDDGGRIVSNPAISNWRSSDTDVATVDGSGRVQALAAGTTTISATWTHNGTPINGRMTLHVRQLGAITLTATPAEIEVGGTSVLTVSIAYTDSNKQPTATSAPPVGWVVTPEAGRTDGWKVNNTHVSFDASTRTATGASDGTTAISYSITRSGRANSGSPKSGETTITVISKIGTIDPYAAGGSSGFIIR